MAPESESCPPAGQPRLRINTAALTVLVSIGLGTTGSVLQGYASETYHALAVYYLLLVAGSVLIRIFLGTKGPEFRAFLFTFGMCVLAGGLAQVYAMKSFGVPQSFVDALGFYNALMDRPPYYSWEDLRTLWVDGFEVSRGAPLAIVWWQWAYHIRYLLGLDYGPYVGVMLNALTMGLVASITVRAARDLFGDSRWRLDRVAILSGFCGLYLLFGALLLRDCFTTLLNALVLWAIVRWIRRPNVRSAFFAAVLTAASVAGMTYLRSRTNVLFGAVWALGFGLWYFATKLNVARMLTIVAVVSAAAVGSVYVFGFVELSQKLHSKYSTQYGEHIGGESRDDSLAMRLIVNQPLPIRLVLGAASMAIRPIPLWAGVGPGVSEYFWLKGYNGLYQVVVFPLFAAGAIIVLRDYRRDRASATPQMFILAYFLFTVLAVVATTMEQRHIAQFMPAFMLVAAVPDKRIDADRRILGQISVVWFGIVGLVHLAWFLASMNR